VRNFISIAVLAVAALAMWPAWPNYVAVAYPLSHKQPIMQDWPVYGGQEGGDHYSPLTQINTSNVHQLKVAWTLDTHEQGGLQTNPLIIQGILYAYTPSQKVIALDAATGKVDWTFDPGIVGRQPTRGLSYWSNGTYGILFASANTNLYALDPISGKTIPSFGDGGKIDLRKGLIEGDYIKEFAALTSPGVIFKDMIIVGFKAPETEPALRGDIRAFDVHTGTLRWTFHTIPRPGEVGYDSWPKGAWKVTGAANNWAGMVLDRDRGILFAPTGSAVNDFYGYDRIGDDLFANTLLALDANTGKRIWHFQAVHHDLWDRDFPSPPALITVRRNGKTVDAVAQTTKQGYIFLFDRSNGKSLFPIEERAFPSSDVPGEKASSTQPIPLAPAPFARQLLTADMLTTRTPESHAWALERFKQLRSEGQFVPFSVDKQTIIFPGFDGGAEWGGPAVDIRTGVIYINSNDIAWTGGLTENEVGEAGSAIYKNQCSACHGADRKGVPGAFPSLVDMDKRLSDLASKEVIKNGRGRMPGFPKLSDSRLESLLFFLNTGHDSENVGETPKSPAPADSSSKHEAESTTNPVVPAKYRFTGYQKFLDPDGYPAVVPPWGTLNAIDLNTGKFLWKIPLGEYPELAAKGVKNTGSENYGGPIVTAGGIVFIGSTIYDRKIRAFDSKTGRLLWEAELPYAGNATPATYMIEGKQYIVIATSGGRNRKGPQGAAYIAFAL
jgi:quinoprotein glucose dehydrogenase